MIFYRDTYVERKPGEIINDRNDRAIRVTAKWYNSHLSAQKLNIKAILLTEDEENKRKAAEEGIPVATSKYFRISLVFQRSNF